MGSSQDFYNFIMAIEKVREVDKDGQTHLRTGAIYNAMKLAAKNECVAGFYVDERTPGVKIGYITTPAGTLYWPLEQLDVYWIDEKQYEIVDMYRRNLREKKNDSSTDRKASNRK